jgi:ketosteroid isomerase-like protein
VSNDNAEIIRRFTEAFNRRDYAACLEVIDPDVEWHPPPDIPNAAVARGRDELIANFQDWLGAWDDYQSVPEEILEGKDDTILVFGRESARGKDSGIEVSSRPIAGVYELREGRIVRFRATKTGSVPVAIRNMTYLDRCAARAAAGLTA